MALLMNDANDSPSLLQSKCPAGLYLVPTPIGHLGDMTLRAIDLLKKVDVIACEDTRVSRKLLNHYEIETKLITYHEHNAKTMRPKLLEQLKEGAAIALISDAGTPLISDPGYKLVLEAQQLAIRVTPLAGATAITTALCASGLPSDAFAFIGFLPNKEQARQAHLKRYASFEGTLIAYESPKRVLLALASIALVMGEEREVVMARELTKQFEEIIRLPVAALLSELTKRESIKGEIVLLIAPPKPKQFDALTVDALLKEALAQGSTKAAAKAVAQQTGLSVSQLYERALALKSS